MEQTLDLAKLNLGEITGEHFLRVEASETLAQVIDKLRDHQCAAAIFAEGGQWRVISADLLPEWLLQGQESLQKEVSTVAEPLTTLSSQDSLAKLQAALTSHTWVGAVSQGDVVSMLHWTSWARFTAQRRVTSPYVFAPEWGHKEAPLARV